MVNGWCFGGAFTPLIACDLAIAAEDAMFGLSEINWGIIPGGVVSKAITEVIGQRQALYHVMTGENFDGSRAAAMGLVNEAVPGERLRQRTRSSRACSGARTRRCCARPRSRYQIRPRHDLGRGAEDICREIDQTAFQDPERGREQGMKQFLDEKTYRPGLGGYKRED